MHVATAVLVARPGCEGKLEKILRELVQSVANQPGVLEYTLHRAMDSSGRFYFYERYVDQAAMDAHVATPEFKRVLELAPELCEGNPTIDLYQPLASVTELRKTAA